MAAEDQFIIHHYMVLTVRTDSMKQTAEMNEGMKLLPHITSCFAAYTQQVKT